jgi:subtilisin family serine protease
MRISFRIYLGFLLVLGGLCLPDGGRLAADEDQKIRGSAVDFRLNRKVLVVYKEGQSDAARRKAEASGLEVLEDYKPGRFLRCQPKPGIATLMSARVNQVAADASVQVVEPNYAVSIPRPPGPIPARVAAAVRTRAAAAPRAAAPCTPPNDGNLGKLWGMVNCRALDAWCFNHDSAPDVIVAVIDTGVDYNHEDLKANIWTNPGETAGNGTDDDGNGIVDDIHGAKFDGGVGSGDPMDDNEHGTHCAGTIAGVGNNMIGVVGVNWKVQIMALKFLRADGSGSTNDAIKCIDYAIAKGAKIMSNSWGGGGRSQALADAITRAEQKGILFVAAASNDSLDNDANPSYPASFDNANVLAVAAITPSEDLAFYSNFGAKSVDIAAPGGAADGNKNNDIFSTLPGNQYGALAGTSMATPHISGAAALALGHPAYKSATAVELKGLLMKNARSLSSLSGKCVTGGTLDLGFLTSSGTDMPSKVAYVGTSNQTGGVFMLNNSSGDALYCLGGGGFYQTKLTSEGTATTPDGFLGWVYKEDYPFSPYMFLFTKDTIGNTPYQRVYARPADNSSAPFTWFCDATRCKVSETDSTAKGLRSGAFDRLRERVQMNYEKTGH